VRAEFEGTQKLSSTALSIRRSIERWREPSFITAYTSVASQLMLTAAETSRSMFFAAEPGVLSVNSNLSLNWQSVDFGYPGRASFHTSGVNERYLRVFRVNPSTSTTADVESHAEDIELTFGVSASLRGKVVDMMTAELLGSPAFPTDLGVL